MRHYYKVVAIVLLLGLIVVIPLDVLGPVPIQKTVLASKPRILIVPGHEPTDGGAIYKDLHERKIVVEIADALTSRLEAGGNIDVVVTRDNESWSLELQEYFDMNKDEINAWVVEQKEKTNKAIDSGELEEVESVQHNNAPANTALHLYGINKWMQEEGNNFDLVVYLHVNDDVRKNRKIPGKYSGFSIYVPESQYINSKSSKEFGEIINKNLKESYAPSNLKIEEDTIIESQELIALGRYQTLDETPVALIEYGYIYEPIFSESERRETVETMANKTEQAIKVFLSL